MRAALSILLFAGLGFAEPDPDAERTDAMRSLTASEAKLDRLGGDVLWIKQQIVDAQATLESTRNSLDRAEATRKLEQLKREIKQKKSKAR